MNDFKKTNIDLTIDKWLINDKETSVSDLVFENKNGQLFISNNSNDKIALNYINKISLDKKNKTLEIDCDGNILNGGGGCIYLNGFELPLKGKALMPVSPPLDLSFYIEINGNSSLTISKIEIIEKSDEYDNDLLVELSQNPDVLVVVPDYPSAKNLYMSAFAHTRNQEYVKQGLKIQVASLQEGFWYSMIYEIDGINVFKGDITSLKKLIEKKQYRVIVNHFVDVNHYCIYDGYITNEQLVFICHGPETIFEVLPNKTRNYFSKELPEFVENKEKRDYVKKYSQKSNVQWVFVSEWLKQKSEELLSDNFKNSNVIGNYINEKLFSYHQKTEEDRKKILVLRKFDNICQHSIDQVVLCILELSRRSFFNDLEFNIYGDGYYYDELLEPIKGIPNVKLHRTFLPQYAIPKVHEQNGILLIPSRHDAHAVSMSEGASSGLVVVGSNVTSNPYFMDDKNNHTMVDPEDYHALADVIERLYYNPKEFLSISKNLSSFVRKTSSKKNTIDREITLIKKCYEIADKKWNTYPVVSRNLSKKVITVLVAAYNVEPWIDKCLYSLVSHRNAPKTEILVVNDGSSDLTSEIAHQYEKSTKGVVRVIDKQNGGHGSTINVGIAEAKGKYFRIVDGDDWVDSENFAKLVDILEKEETDLVLTTGSYEYYNKAKFENIINYDMLHEGTTYHFDDLLHPYYGFTSYGPLLTTSNFKTEILRKSNFTLSEHKPYVDMEFNVFSKKIVDTVKYFNLNIYRYLIGRQGQTISRDFWKRKYKDHEYVIFNILDKISEDEDFSENRKNYVYKNILSQMIDSQIFMFDQVMHLDEIDEFVDRLSKHGNLKDIAFEYIYNKNDASKTILENYHKYNKNVPIINVDGSNNVGTKGFKKTLKSIIKKTVPKKVINAGKRILGRV